MRVVKDVESECLMPLREWLSKEKIIVKSKGGEVEPFAEHLSRAPRHTENPYCEMVTLLRPFVVQDPSLFSRLPGHKRVSFSVSKE